MTEDQIHTILAATSRLDTSLARVETKVDQLQSENTKADALHEKLDVRITALEKFRWQLAGAWALAGSGVGAAFVALITRTN